MSEQEQSSKAELEIGGVAVSQLQADFQTPLYIIDQADLEQRLDVFQNYFQSDQLDCRLVYASKAFMNLYMAGLLKEKDFYLDVVSGGELYTALKAGFDPARIYFHGNNKSKDEIKMALEAGIGCFVIDNRHEYLLLSHLASELGLECSALLRVNPGIEAETHPYIQTSNLDSKFGVPTLGSAVKDLVVDLSTDPTIDFRGFHCHLGSQIQDENYFFQEAKGLIAFAKEIVDALAIPLKEINFGGGFGVSQLPQEESLDYASFLSRYSEKIVTYLDQYELEIESIAIEPGRSVINHSGYTLYTVGYVKESLEGLPLVCVDGGMSDNLRPALYGAEYHAVLANKMDQPAEKSYRLAGKLCESGDILIQQVDLAPVESGDLVLIPSSGAYTYSMSSNYNMLGRPAVVFVKDGQAQLAVQRQSYEDLIRGQLFFDKNY